jgi:hypothetical protein
MTHMFSSCKIILIVLTFTCLAAAQQNKCRPAEALHRAGTEAARILGGRMGSDLARKQSWRNRSRDKQHQANPGWLYRAGEFLRRRRHAPPGTECFRFRHPRRQMEANLGRQRRRLPGFCRRIQGWTDGAGPRGCCVPMAPKLCSAWCSRTSRMTSSTGVGKDRKTAAKPGQSNGPFTTSAGPSNQNS